MKAAYIGHPGPPESIRYGELPAPVVGEQDVLVKVAAVTVDPIDTYIRSGAYGDCHKYLADFSTNICGTGPIICDHEIYS